MVHDSFPLSITYLNFLIITKTKCTKPFPEATLTWKENTVEVIIELVEHSFVIFCNIISYFESILAGLHFSLSHLLLLFDALGQYQRVSTYSEIHLYQCNIQSVWS